MGYFLAIIIRTYLTKQRKINNMKKESKFSRVKKMADRAQTYTATMTPKTLDALDSLDGSRSSKIEKAVKAFYGIGE